MGPDKRSSIDSHIMAMFGEARERTGTEFHDPLTASGFAVRRVITTASPFRSLRPLIAKWNAR